jgi:HD domain-containing protein
MVLTSVALLDELLQHHASALGNDFTAYRNHTYRLINFCSALAGDAPVSLEKMAIAGAFHDLGIWTDKTFDYLPPSERLAREYLTRQGKLEWASEINGMIREHHKLTRYQANPNWLVEAFRRADLVDVSLGIITFGLPRKFVREVRSRFPNTGFHKRLIQLSLSRLLSHPLSPLPMYRL